MFDLFQSVEFLGTKPAPPPPGTAGNGERVSIEKVDSDDPRIWKADGSPNVDMRLHPGLSTAMTWKNWFVNHGYPDSGALILLLFTDWSFRGKYPDMYWWEIPKPKFPIEREQLFLTSEELKVRFKEVEKVYRQYYEEARLPDVTIPAPGEVPGVPVIQAGVFDQVTEYLKNPYVLGGLAIAGFLLLRKKL